MEILNKRKYENYNKIDLGGGRMNIKDHINIDITNFIDKGGNECVDIVMDVENEVLPFENDSIDEILADNVLEHLGEGFIFALNECHRVLKKGSVIRGVVPVAGTNTAWQDITHKRFFVIDSFGYLCGENKAMDNRPSHPRYADYGVLPWNQVELKKEGELIHFTLSPRK